MELRAKISIRIKQKNKHKIIIFRDLSGFKFSKKAIIPAAGNGVLEIDLDKRGYVRLLAFIDRDGDIRVDIYHRNKSWIKYWSRIFGPNDAGRYTAVIDPLKVISSQ